MCEYCDVPTNVDLKCTLVIHGKYDNFDTYKKEWYKVNYSSEICIDEKMNYCPMCGRKLGK